MYDVLGGNYTAEPYSTLRFAAHVFFYIKIRENGAAREI